MPRRSTGCRTGSRAALFDRLELTEQTLNTITDREALASKLDEIRERGYAFSDEKRTVGMRAVGAPIVLDDRRVLGGVSVSGPTTCMNGEWFREEVPELVRQSSQAIVIKAMYS